MRPNPRCARVSVRTGRSIHGCRRRVRAVRFQPDIPRMTVQRFSMASLQGVLGFSESTGSSTCSATTMATAKQRQPRKPRARADCQRMQVSPLYILEHLVGENMHRSAMSITRLECQVSELVNSDACPCPTIQGSCRTSTNEDEAWVVPGARDGARPNVMGLASLGLEIGIFGDFLYSVLLLDAILGLDLLGRALSRSQVVPGRGWTALGRICLAYGRCVGSECTGSVSTGFL
jgi:hypothetical protein